jgi:hypothetical protein
MGAVITQTRPQFYEVARSGEAEVETHTASILVERVPLHVHRILTCPVVDGHRIQRHELVLSCSQGTSQGFRGVTLGVGVLLDIMVGWMRWWAMVHTIMGAAG